MMEEHLGVGSATGSPEGTAGRSVSAEHPAGSVDTLRRILAAVRDDLGFDTASLFLLDQDDGVWALVARAGPVRPWHPLLDPAVIAGLADGGSYPDARQVPGVGLRLAGLGCGGIVVHAVEDDGCLVLDAGSPRRDRTDEPDEGLLASLARAIGDVRRPEGSPPEDEVRRLRRLIDATARGVGAWRSLPDVLGLLRRIVGAEELVLVCDDADGPKVVRAGEGPEPPTSAVRAILRILPPTGPIPGGLAQRLGGSLGLRGSVRAAACHPDVRREVLVGSWERETESSKAALEVAARLTGIARAAAHVRPETIRRYLEPERTRWAHEIHDGVTQAVTAAVIQIENLRGLIEADPGAAAEALEGAQEEIRGSLNDLRGIMADLSETGTADEPVQPLRRMIEDVVRRWRLPARISVSGQISGLPRQVLSTALLVVREALTNAAKHSGAERIGVDVVVDADGLTATVEDDGGGFDPSTVERRRLPTHLGMRLMRWRVADVGGAIEVSSAPGAGTRIIARIPVPAASEEADRRGGPAR